jgi:hypothetical protein
VSSGANSGQQTTAPKISDHSDMSSLEQHNAPGGPRAPLVPSIASCAKRIFPSGVPDREEVSQYLLRIDDGNGLLMKGGILNVCPALAGRGVS